METLIATGHLDAGDSQADNMRDPESWPKCQSQPLRSSNDTLVRNSWMYQVSAWVFQLELEGRASRLATRGGQIASDYGLGLAQRGLEAWKGYYS